MFGETLSALKLVSPTLVGSFNVESGNAGFSSEFLSPCDECSGQSSEGLQFDCVKCGRSKNNYLFTTSGDGDSVYTVWRFGAQAVLVIFDSNYGIANVVRNALLSSTAPNLDDADLTVLASSLATHLGVISLSTTMVVADVYGPSRIGDSYVPVEVEGLAEGTYELWSFVEPSDAYTGPLGPRDVVTVRAVLAIHPVLANQLSLPQEINVDWKQHLGAMGATMVASHVAPMGESVRQINSLIKPAPSPSPASVEATSATNTKPNFCPNCGTARVHDAQFCGACGQNLGEISNAGSSQPAELAAVDLIDTVLLNSGVESDSAREKLIASADLYSMKIVALNFFEREDLVNAEFWFHEMATIGGPHPSRCEGVLDLCSTLLIPGNRFAEASLYLRHVEETSDGKLRHKARGLLAEVEKDWQKSGLERFQFSDAWQTVDLTAPQTADMTQIDVYHRALGMLFDRDEKLRPMFTDSVDSFLPNVIGFLNGVASKTGTLHRDIYAQAFIDWLRSR